MEKIILLPVVPVSQGQHACAERYSKLEHNNKGAPWTAFTLCGLASMPTTDRTHVVFIFQCESCRADRETLRIVTTNSTVVVSSYKVYRAANNTK